ncbi:hypothetical protein SAMN05444003_0912 [Cognatiyoonia sediminum]|uniref:Uncharacterized protein n=1 Tax=Cognatiyoonia sediminum TaxID=1508389 RepID=A0A1M5MMM6_9RHOB|nr:hypothetical protein [Cognatiyoonia sediminum]SHG78548.1 hypothetical protein SAMN05444003_0912 [Cognatiyoonia sediminum]
MCIKKFSAISALSIATVLALSSPTSAADEDRVTVRTELQVAMQRHVDRNLIEGVVLHVDLESGDLMELYPTTAHPMIMASDEYFIVRADLVDAEGGQFDVDYYMAETDRGYKVIRTEIDNRSDLKELVGAGLVAQY